MTSRRAVTRIDVDEVLDPAPGTGKPAKATRAGPIRLTTADDIRVEMAKVYRAAKRGQMPTQDATRLVYILGEMRKAIELDVIEQRVQELEDDHARTAGRA